MNENLKSLLIASLIVTTLVASYGIISITKTYGRSSEPTSFRSFRVTATGESVTVPDIAQFSFGVMTEGGTDVASLQQKNTEAMNKAITFLKDLEIDEKDIKTTNYSINPRYTYPRCFSGGPCPPPTVQGYTIQQNVSVKIRDFDKIGDTLSGVVGVGANNVQQLQFTVDDPTKVEQEARKDAIVRAQEKAREIADAGDFRLGRLLSIEESFSGGIPTTLRNVAFGGDAVEESFAPAIEPGSEQINVTVTLIYEIE